MSAERRGAILGALVGTLAGAWWGLGTAGSILAMRALVRPYRRWRARAYATGAGTYYREHLAGQHAVIRRDGCPVCLERPPLFPARPMRWDEEANGFVAAAPSSIEPSVRAPQPAENIEFIPDAGDGHPALKVAPHPALEPGDEPDLSEGWDPMASRT